MKSNLRQEMVQVHGEEFVKGFEQEFDLNEAEGDDDFDIEDNDPESPMYPLRLRLLDFLQSRKVIYIAGLIDGILATLLFGMLFGYLP